MSEHNWIDKIKASRAAVQHAQEKITGQEVVKTPLLPENIGNHLALENKQEFCEELKAQQDTEKTIKSLPETLAGRYKLERILGVGGMAVVYRAFDRLAAHFNSPSPYVALKTFKEEFAGYTDASYLLYSEYALTTKLNHQHIVRAYQFDVDTESERAFITLEFLRGITLDQWLINNPLGVTFKKAKPMILELMDAMSHSHSLNILHGDLKPSNVMLTNEGCKIFDYGLGQALAGDMAKLPKISRKRFNAWTPKYAAPELLEDVAITTKTDMFALCCIVYELLTGKNPYYIDKKTKYSIKLVKPKDLPKKMWVALENGLATDPELRKITIDELKEAFSKFNRFRFFSK